MTDLRLLLSRREFGDDSTLGKLYAVEAAPLFLCYTLEDELRDVKVPGETAIPVGVYEILPRTEGGMHKKYAARYGLMHVGMMWLQNVLDFKWVYLHVGNTDDETEGCPLVGTNYMPLGDGNFKVTGSRTAYVQLYKRVAEAWAEGRHVFITVTNEEVQA